MSLREKAVEAANNIIKRRTVLLCRSAKACFLDSETARVPTEEGRRVIADLRRFAYLDRRGGHTPHSFLRDLGGRIDPLSMARIEGRREVVNRLLDFVELDPEQIRQIAEVDDGRN